ncbi:hypothetical protein FZEAL_3436 [Fusarium zealandicum]|uniref:Uncharacterized protein n=1 Tax=Fusarium zealandicum TaxID=1053134 RepID=A0A8H4XML0_9HYPO|nr:hypothetical protein FZEAL_3436 [Fusarium zealandicum]
MPPHRKFFLTMSQTTHLGARDDDDCLGWNCLTAAEQFGIIFSIIVTSLVLILAYMYYLGRITSSHQEIVLARQSRHRRRRSNLVPSISMGQVSVLPQPASQPQVIYQPMIYSLNGTPVSFPQPQVHMSHFPPQAVPMMYPVRPIQPHQQQPSFPPHPSGDVGGRPVHRSSSVSSRGLPSRQPTWRQRLCRALGLPIGRASTIASSAPGTPVRSRSHSEATREYGRRSLSGSRGGGNAHPSSNSQASRVGRSRSNWDRRGGPDRPQSPSTDLATVHSDDYDLITSPETLPDRGHPFARSNRPSAMTSRVRAVQGSSSANSAIYSDDRQTIPTVSSVRRPYDAQSRPLTPIPLDGYRETSPSRRDPTFSKITLEQLPGWQRDGAPKRSLIDRFWRNSDLPDPPEPSDRNNRRILFHRGRDINRTDWDRRHTDPSQTTDDDAAGPCTPRSVHQGGGSY